MVDRMMLKGVMVRNSTVFWLVLGVCSSVICYSSTVVIVFVIRLMSSLVVVMLLLVSGDSVCMSSGYFGKKVCSA